MYNKANAYIKIFQIKNQMSLQQHRVFDSLITLLQKNRNYNIEDLTKPQGIEFDLHDFENVYSRNLNLKRLNRKQLKDAIESLVHITLATDVQTEEVDSVEFNTIFQKAKIDFKNKKVSFVFSNLFTTDYLLPTTEYTRLSSEHVNSLTKAHSRLLYQQFKMLIGRNGFRNSKKMSIDELKNLLGVQNSKTYDISSQFTNKVIKPSIKEITKKTDIVADYKVLKKGRIVEGYEFVFNKKKIGCIDLQVETNQVIKDEPNFNTEGALEAELISNEEEVLEIEIIGDESGFKSMKAFRQHMIVKYVNISLPKVLINGIQYYSKISKEGYLMSSKKVIYSASIAELIWKEHYKNQHMLLNTNWKENLFEDKNVNIFDLYEE